MMVMLKMGVFGGILVLGMMAIECKAEQPCLPPPVPSLAPAVGVPYGPGYYGYGFARLGYVPYQLPYFALHPPVYYSYPVPRPYGYSPFAYPPGTMTPEAGPPMPLVIQNRFVPKKPATTPTRDKVAQAPLRIVNPYVAQADGATQAGRTVSVETRPVPQVIYPATTAGQL